MEFIDMSDFLILAMKILAACIFACVVIFIAKTAKANKSKIKPEALAQEQPLWVLEYEALRKKRIERKEWIERRERIERREWREKRPLWEFKCQRLKREERERKARLHWEKEEDKKRLQLEEQERLQQEEQKRLQLEEQERLRLEERERLRQEEQKRLQLEEQEKIKLAFEIKEDVELLLVNNEYRKLLEGFVLNMSQDLFLDCKALEYFDYSLIRDYPRIKQLDEFLFYDDKKHRMFYAKGGWYIDSPIGLNKNTDSTPFGKLFTIFKSKVKFKSDLHCLISIWGALKKIAINHFFEQFADEYRECCYLFKDGFKDVLITDYLNPEVDKKATMKLSYYLLHNDTTQTKSLFKYYEEIIERVKIEKKERSLANFEELLLSRTDKLSKVFKIEDVDMMDGYQFENFVYVLFSKMGYVTQITKASGDQGVDVIAEKGAMKIAIQAKCYSGNVPNSSVQQIVAGARHYNCNKKIVVTNSQFTPSAIELAHSNNVVLWDRDLLKEKLSEAQVSAL